MRATWPCAMRGSFMGAVRLFIYIYDLSQNGLAVIKHIFPSYRPGRVEVKN